MTSAGEGPTGPPGDHRRGVDAPPHCGAARQRPGSHSPGLPVGTFACRTQSRCITRRVTPPRPHFTVDRGENLEPMTSDLIVEAVPRMGANVLLPDPCVVMEVVGMWYESEFSKRRCAPTVRAGEVSSRGTSLIRNRLPIGPYSRPMPRAL